MPALTKGSFSLNLGIVKLGADLSDDDRQRAWEMYTELSARVAGTGKADDPDCVEFGGELYIESLDSLYNFFREARGVMRKFPAGRLSRNHHNHLGAMISRTMTEVLRPFLEKWQVKNRHWWEYQSNPRLAPLERQKEYYHLQELLDDWTAVRWLMRELQKELVRVYALVDVG